MSEEEIFNKEKKNSKQEQAKAPERLKFTYYDEALRVLKDKIGPINGKIQINFGYSWPAEWPFQGEHAYDQSMSGLGVVDEKKNKCVFGVLNLVTGEILTRETECVHWN